MTETEVTDAPTDDETRILQMIATMTYDEISLATGFSRGKIYASALKFGARKNEARIREKAADRRRRQRETLEAIIDTTATSDVLDYLDSLPEGCARLVLTSPPYNVGRLYGSAAGDSLRHIYWLGWLMQIVSEASRILSEGGVLALQVGATRDHADQVVPIDMLIHDAIMKTGLTFQNRVTWVIPHGLTPRRRLAGRSETVLIYSKGPVPEHFNADSARTPQKQPGKRAFKGPNKGALSGNRFGAWPSDVWQISNVGANCPERTGHPAQMPEELAQRVMNLYTMPGDLVVDPFSGSGTTAAVAIATGRRFSGCDLMYGDIRAARLAKAGLADFCSLPGVSDESVAVWQAEAMRVDHEPRQLDLLKVA